MMRPNTIDHNQRGFTLIEIIITLIVASIFSIFIIAFMGTNTERSAAPLLQAQNNYKTVAAMEIITAKHKRFLIDQSDPLNHFKNNACVACPCDQCDTTWIAFDGSDTETPCTPPGCRVVKVTVRTGKQSLTALFTN